MLYLSEKTGKSYKTVEELEAAEKEFDKAEAEKKALVEVKKARAKEVEDAYLELQKVREEAFAKISEAETKWIELRDKFAEDYHGYHMTYSNINGKKEISFSDLVDSIVRNW